jgi:hypothetical protein
VTDTLVTVEFNPSGTSTEVVLIHARFLTEADRDEHLKGWTGCIDRLNTALSEH